MTDASLQASVMVLTMATLLVTARQYIGDPIDCMVEVTMMRKDTLKLRSNGRVDNDKWWYFEIAFKLYLDELSLLPRASLETSWTHTVGFIPPSLSQKGLNIFTIITLTNILKTFWLHCCHYDRNREGAVFWDIFAQSPTSRWPGLWGSKDRTLPTLVLPPSRWTAESRSITSTIRWELCHVPDQMHQVVGYI